MRLAINATKRAISATVGFHRNQSIVTVSNLRFRVYVYSRVRKKDATLSLLEFSDFELVGVRAETDAVRVEKFSALEWRKSDQMGKLRSICRRIGANCHGIITTVCLTSIYAKRFPPMASL